MSHYRMTQAERQARIDARALILAVANADKRPGIDKRLHIQRAVCKVRRRRWMDGETLLAAGFRASAS